MRNLCTALITSFLILSNSAQAEEAQVRDAIGTARLFTNDFIGDGEDRWRTGSYQISHFRGNEWAGALPAEFGALLEYRLRTEILAPENLSNPAEDDRRYAGLLSFGVHSQTRAGALDLSLGADIVLIGPQTGIGSFQRDFHEAVGAPLPDLDNQIGDEIFLNVLAEASRSYSLGEQTLLRPFAEAQVGHETYVRIGADLVFGALGQGALFGRDSVTGTLMRANKTQPPGYSFLLGGDVAYVEDSALLPEGGVTLNDQRHRLRAGVQRQGEGNSQFYGLTWLSEEFDTQEEPQFVGSVTLDFSF